MNKTLAALAAIALGLNTSGLRADSLRDIYELALENDAQLKSEEARYRADLEQEKIGLSALLPQVNANYDYTDVDQDTERPNLRVAEGGGFEVIDTSTNIDTDRDGWGVRLDQAIFDLPAWFTFQSGKELSLAAEATLAANQQNLIVRVVEAYLLVLRAKDNLEASKAAERAFERQLEQTQQRFEVGLIAITDVYEAQAAYDLAQVARIEDENAVLVALESLSVLTGQHHSNLHELTEEFKIDLPQPNDRAAWVEFALENNFTLQAASYREEAARQNAKANRLEHAPKISGNYQYSDYSTDGDLTIRPDTGFITPPDSDVELNQWQIRLDVPLYSGGRISANRRAAAEEYIFARETHINRSRQTVTETRSQYMTVVSNVSRVKARQQSIVSSKSALDATQAGYEVGTRNVVDVLNAQNTLFSAERDYANSRYDYILSILRLKEQAGQLSPQDVYNLDAFLVPPAPPTASGGK